MTAQSPSMFAVPTAYERFMGRWSARLALGFIEFADARSSDRVLDVGCGTGSLALALAAAAPDADITGIDPSESFVGFARSRTSSPRVQFLVGDAQALPFSSQTFGHSLSMLVFNFIPDPAKALAEMRRVTRSGGVVAAAVWDHEEGMALLNTFWDVVGETDQHAPREERQIFREDSMIALFEAADLAAVRSSDILIPLEFTSFDDYWSPFLGGQGPAGKYVVSLSAARQDELRARLRQRLLGLNGDGPFSMRARAWAVRGDVVPRS